MSDVDDLLKDTPKTEKPAKKAKGDAAEKPAKGSKKAAPAAEKPAKGAKKAAPAAEKPAAKKAAAKPAKGKAGDEGDDAPMTDAAKAILKLKKRTSYADLAEKTEIDIRTLRRTARQLRDAGKIDLVKEGTSVFIVPASI